MRCYKQFMKMRRTCVLFSSIMQTCHFDFTYKMNHQIVKTFIAIWMLFRVCWHFTDACDNGCFLGDTRQEWGNLVILNDSLLTTERQKTPLFRRIIAKTAINFVMKLGKGVTIPFVSCLVSVVLADNAMHGWNVNRP